MGRAAGGETVGISLSLLAAIRASENVGLRVGDTTPRKASKHQALTGRKVRSGRKVT